MENFDDNHKSEGLFDVDEVTRTASLELYPVKSKARYEATYNMFKQWCVEKKINSFAEENVLLVLLAYFVERSQKLKSPASLWSEYSMLKTSISINDNKDISKHLKLLAFLKRKNVGYKPKKSNVFTREEVNKFLSEAPDDTYLLMKLSCFLDYNESLLQSCFQSF